MSALASCGATTDSFAQNALSQQQRQQRQTDICDAADIREPSAAVAPIQRHQPGFPPAQNVNSVALAELPARQFSG